MDPCVDKQHWRVAAGSLAARIARLVLTSPSLNQYMDIRVQKIQRKLKIFSPPSPKKRRRSYAAMSRLMDEYALEARALTEKSQQTNSRKNRILRLRSYVVQSKIVVGNLYESASCGHDLPKVDEPRVGFSDL